MGQAMTVPLHPTTHRTLCCIFNVHLSNHAGVDVTVYHIMCMVVGVLVIIWIFPTIMHPPYHVL